MPPDEVRVSSQGPDGNGVSVNLRDKKFALTGPNVALLLLICIIGAVAWLRTGTIDKTLKSGQEQLTATEGRVQQRVSELFVRLDKFFDDLQQQQLLLNTNNAKVTAGQVELRTHFDESLRRQDELLHSQTNAIDVKVNTLEKYIEAWFSEIGTRLEWLDHNVANPERRMPLRAPSPSQERQQERSR